MSSSVCPIKVFQWSIYRFHWSEPFSFLNTDLDNILLDRQKLKSEQWNMKSNCLHCKMLFVCVCFSKVFQLYNFDIIWCTCRSSHTLIYTIIIVKTIYQQIADTLKSQKLSLYTNYFNDSKEFCLSIGLHQLCQQVFWTKSISKEKILGKWLSENCNIAYFAFKRCRYSNIIVIKTGLNQHYAHFYKIEII